MAKEAPADRIRVSEVYNSIQGESSLAGTPTVFVRLFACNLRCAWCDSAHAVEGKDFEEMDAEDLVGRVAKLAGMMEGRRGIRHVCWTGGEPLLQWRAMARAIDALPDHVAHSVETNGEVPVEPLARELADKRRRGLLRFIMDVKCPGSGVTAKIAFANLPRLQPADEVKFVIANRADYAFARDVVTTRDIAPTTILFAPVTRGGDVKRGLRPATLAAWILKDRLDVRLQLQLHKLVWPRRSRGI